MHNPESVRENEVLFFFFFFFFVDYYKIWSSGRDLVIRLYLKIPEKFVRPHFPGKILGCAYTLCS